MPTIDPQEIDTREGDFDWGAVFNSIGPTLTGIGAIVQGANVHKVKPPVYNQQTYVEASMDKLKRMTWWQWLIVGGSAALLITIIIVATKNKTGK